MIYTLTLNPALDYDIYIDNLEAGNLNIVKNNKFRAGGKGINVSIMLNNLGVNNVCLGYLGGFTGKQINKLLKEKKLNTDFINIDEDNRINIKINDNNGETEINGVSPIISEKEIYMLYEKLEKLKEDDILILSGSINSCLEENFYYTLSTKTKAKVVLDTRGNLILKNINKNILIKPNMKELEEMYEEEINSIDKLYETAKKILDQGIEYVLVSDGEKGAYLVTKNKLIKANTPKGIYINSIGAGDSTVAGFITGYIQNLSDIEKLKLAVACGSSTAYSYEIGTKEEVENLINDIKCEEIIYGN